MVTALLPRRRDEERVVCFQRRWEVDIGATWKRNIERNLCVLIYSHRNKVTVWSTMLRYCKSTKYQMHMERHKICTLSTVRIQIGAPLLTHTSELEDDTGL
jgi:hypothetical protein